MSYPHHPATEHSSSASGLPPTKVDVKDGVPVGSHGTPAPPTPQDSGFLDGGASETMDSRTTSTSSSLLSKTSADAAITPQMADSSAQVSSDSLVFSLGACYRASGSPRPRPTPGIILYDRISWRHGRPDGTGQPRRPQSSPAVQSPSVKVEHSAAGACCLARSSFPTSPVGHAAATSRSPVDFLHSSRSRPTTGPSRQRQHACGCQQGQRSVLDDAEVTVHGQRGRDNAEENRLMVMGDREVSCHSSPAETSIWPDTASAPLMRGWSVSSSLGFWLSCCCVPDHMSEDSDVPVRRPERSTMTQVPQSQSSQTDGSRGLRDSDTAGTTPKPSPVPDDHTAGGSSPGSDDSKGGNMFFIGASPSGDESDESEAAFPMEKAPDSKDLVVTHTSCTASGQHNRAASQLYPPGSSVLLLG